MRFEHTSKACRALVSASVLLLVAGQHAFADDFDGVWTPLFDGRSLSGWETWLGKPHASVEGLELRRGDDGKYAEPLGLNHDPKGVFSVVELDGAPAIRISGEIFGALTSLAEYDDFHLKLEFRWGALKWPPRENAARDSGVLYYAVGEHGATNNGAWMRSLECQVQEHDVGDFWGVEGAAVDVPGDRIGEGRDLRLVFRPDAPLVPVEGTPRRAIKGFDNERPTGAWNTVEVLCLRGSCLHAVNGKVNLVLRHPRQPGPNGQWAPLTRGRLQIQSEGAEVFYRNIAVRHIDRFPPEYGP